MMKEASIHDLMHPRWRDEEIERLRLDNERLRAALEMIAGVRQCHDNLLGNADIARIALCWISGAQQLTGVEKSK